MNIFYALKYSNRFELENSDTKKKLVEKVELADFPDKLYEAWRSGCEMLYFRLGND